MHFFPLKAKDLLNKADWRKETTKEPKEAEEGTEHVSGNFFLVTEEMWLEREIICMSLLH